MINSLNNQSKDLDPFEAKVEGKKEVSLNPDALCDQSSKEMGSGRPLVTLALFSYNQENYIREAAEAALTQTYQPLEVIFSDDCSTDNTFKILEEMAACYKGPHKVRLNRNNVNMGIARHVNYVHRIAQGVLIVHAAGDDISLSERTMELYTSWEKSKNRPSVIVSDGYKVDENGFVFSNSIANINCEFSDKPIDKFTRSLPILGCTAAISRELIEKFGPLPEGLTSEDALLYRRAYLMNGVKYIPNKLVKYRSGVGIGVSSISSHAPDSYVKFYGKWARDAVEKWTQLILDMKSVSYQNSEVFLALKKKIEFHKAGLNFAEKGKWRFFFLAFIKSVGVHNNQQILGLVKLAIALKAPGIYSFLKKNKNN